MFIPVNPWAFIDPEDWPHIGVIHSSKDFDEMKHGRLIKCLLKIGLILFSIGTFVSFIMTSFSTWWCGILITTLFSCAICCFVMLLDPPFGPKCDKYTKSIFRIVVFALMILIGGNVCIAGLNMSYKSWSYGSEYSVLNWLFVLGIAMMVVFTTLLFIEGFRKPKDKAPKD